MSVENVFRDLCAYGSVHDDRERTEIITVAALNLYIDPVLAGSKNLLVNDQLVAFDREL